MTVIQSFRDLDVYKLALNESKRIFTVIRSFPEKKNIRSLIRFGGHRGRAVNALIAESWARRRHLAAFKNKLNESPGEAMETQAWLDHALCCDYITSELHGEPDDAWQHVGAMLNRMIQKADDFCKANK